jgi:hypothetical protein
LLELRLSFFKLLLQLIGILADFILGKVKG